MLEVIYPINGRPWDLRPCLSIRNGLNGKEKNSFQREKSRFALDYIHPGAEVYVSQSDFL